MKKYKKEVINNMNKSLMVLVSDSWGIGAELNNPTGNIYVDHLQKKLGFDEKQQKLFSAISKKYIYPDTLLNVLRSKYENKEPPSMYLSSTKKDNPALCEGSHPNEFGHKVIADILYEHIKKHGMC
jgi:hypothetical protein|tara:strand:+ start:353 stop:730 length:378 start_codon:yes stop_codon:yes gene_type:complete